MLTDIDHIMYDTQNASIGFVDEWESLNDVIHNTIVLTNRESRYVILPVFFQIL